MDWYLLDLVLPNARRRIRAVWDALEPLRARVRAAPRRTLVLAGAAGLLLSAALLVTARSGPGDEVPTNEFVGFYCPGCDRYFELSHRQFKQLWDAHEFKSSARQQTLVFKCAKCGKYTAVRADKPPASRSSPSRKP